MLSPNFGLKNYPPAKGYKHNDSFFLFNLSYHLSSRPPSSAPHIAAPEWPPRRTSSSPTRRRDPSGSTVRRQDPGIPYLQRSGSLSPAGRSSHLSWSDESRRAPSPDRCAQAGEPRLSRSYWCLLLFYRSRSSPVASDGSRGTTWRGSSTPHRRGSRGRGRERG